MITSLIYAFKEYSCSNLKRAQCLQNKLSEVAAGVDQRWWFHVPGNNNQRHNQLTELQVVLVKQRNSEFSVDNDASSSSRSRHSGWSEQGGAQLQRGSSSSLSPGSAGTWYSKQVWCSTLETLSIRPSQRAHQQDLGTEHDGPGGHHPQHWLWLPAVHPLQCKVRPET